MAQLVKACSCDGSEDSKQRYLDTPRYEVAHRRDDVPLLLPLCHLWLARQTEDGVNPVMPEQNQSLISKILDSSLIKVKITLLPEHVVKNDYEAD